MKKWLACILLPLMVSVAGLSSSLSGEWSTSVGILPDTSLEATSLSLSYGLGTWSVGGRAELMGTDGYVWQAFELKGALGFVEIEWEVLFGPVAPAFLYTWGSASMDLLGLNMTLYSALVGPDAPGFLSGGPSGGSVFVVKADVGGIDVVSTTGFGARLMDVEDDQYFTINYTGEQTYRWMFLVDPFPGGLQFTYQELALSGMELCCDITFDVRFAFSKEGFDFLKLSMSELFSLWDMFVFDVDVKYTIASKSVSVGSRFLGFDLVACVEVYGDLTVSPWELDLYGFRIRCELGQCGYIEFLTALDVLGLQQALPDLREVFQDDEFEYIKLGFCGPACCGEEYSVDLAVYFDGEGGLFGISRFGAALDVPVLESLRLTASMDVPVVGDASLSFGWVFSF